MIYIIGIETAFILWFFYTAFTEATKQAETTIVVIKEDGVVKLSQNLLEFPDDNLDWLPEGIPQRVTLMIEHLD
jgi:hypothetical protein